MALGGAVKGISSYRHLQQIKELQEELEDLDVVVEQMKVFVSKTMQLNLKIKGENKSTYRC